MQSEPRPPLLSDSAEVLPIHRKILGFSFIVGMVAITVGWDTAVQYPGMLFAFKFSSAWATGTG